LTTRGIKFKKRAWIAATPIKQKNIDKTSQINLCLS
ncbi:unnamed protein product, partial [marine sediment metagenome]